MSQHEQEFLPGSPSPSQGQGQQSGNNAENYPAQPYYWSTRSGAAGTPKDEHPLSYDEPGGLFGLSDYQSGYQAQSQMQSQMQEADADGNTPAVLSAPLPTYAEEKVIPNYVPSGATQEQYSSADGDAFEQGYRPYRSPIGGVPPWARPQLHARRPFRRAGIVVFLLLFALIAGFIQLLQNLFDSPFSFETIAHVLGAILIFGLSAIFVLFMLLLRFIARRRRNNRYWYWRGPWGF